MDKPVGRAVTTGIPVVWIAALVAGVAGVAGCSGDVETGPVPTTVGGARVCRMLSAADVRTVAGGKEPHVTRENVNLDPTGGRLLDAACHLDAGDMSLSLTVDWVSEPADRARARTELSSPAASDARVFPAAAGIGFVRTVRSGDREVSGSLLRGQYRIDVTLSRGPEARDAKADAEALALQAADALAVPVDENAPRPGSPRG